MWTSTIGFTLFKNEIKREKNHCTRSAISPFLTIKFHKLEARNLYFLMMFDIKSGIFYYKKSTCHISRYK